MVHVKKKKSKKEKKTKEEQGGLGGGRKVCLDVTMTKASIPSPVTDLHPCGPLVYD